jgi:phosphocarrier protein
MMNMASPVNSSGKSNQTIARELTIINKRGLHARASAKFVKCAETFKAKVQVTRDGQMVGGTSIMGLMMLAAGPGSTILVEASGPEAQQAVDALTHLVESRFDED